MPYLRAFNTHSLDKDSLQSSQVKKFSSETSGDGYVRKALEHQLNWQPVISIWSQDTTTTVVIDQQGCHPHPLPIADSSPGIHVIFSWKQITSWFWILCRSYF